MSNALNGHFQPSFGLFEFQFDHVFDPSFNADDIPVLELPIKNGRIDPLSMARDDIVTVNPIPMGALPIETFHSPVQFRFHLFLSYSILFCLGVVGGSP
jgi:hypothetical protein